MSATESSRATSDVVTDGPHTAALARLIVAQLQEDLEGAGIVLANFDGTGWLRWEEFKLLAGRWRLPEALRILPPILEPDQPEGAEIVRFQAADGRPDTLNSAWRHSGDGDAIPLPGSLRLVGAAGTGSRFEIDLPGVDNNAGTWTEFIVARNSSAEGDCRLDFSDGTAREVVYIEPSGLMLLSGGDVMRFPTRRPHLYGLWVRNQESRLYVDGQLLLSSRGLAAAGAKQLTFGVYPLSGTGYMENLWSLVRVSRVSASQELPTVLPMPYPIEAWKAAVGELCERQLWPEALATAIRASLIYPRDSSAQALATTTFDQAAGSASGAEAALRAARLVPLGERGSIRPMLTEPVVTCDHVGVRFVRSAPRSLGGHVRRWLRRPAAPEHFWALHDVSFDLRPGEMLAIIGRNGAGKSTLLNVVADLIEPEEGSVQITGRPMLLSMGSGFSPALSGRENIYLSGLYLGLTKSEIYDRFDEIVEFAELWDAIDRPFRTYSSGMMSRLQFALATTVSPDILLLDELLGAGDASFVKKAQARMHQLLRRAHAVITVTHDTEFVRDYCSKAILLEHGRVVYSGSPDKAVLAYLDLLARVPNRALGMEDEDSDG